MLFGLNEFSARLVSGLSAIGTAFLTYTIAKDHVDKETAEKSFLVMLTFPHLWIESRAVVPEFLLTFFMTLSLYFFLKGKYLLGWISVGLAFLTKGPVGLVLPLLVYTLWKKDIKVFRPVYLLVFFLVGGSWYFYMLHEYGLEYFYKFFVYENVMRFTGQRQTHPYGLYYYPLVLFVSTIFYLPVYRKVILSIKGKLLPFFIWFSVVFVFFSLSKNKLHHYILFAYPPLAVLIAYNVSQTYIKRILTVSFLLLCGLLLFAYRWEQERFVHKLRKFPDVQRIELHFYKAENSSLVFYLGRCIPQTERPEGYVVSKEVSNGCSVLLEGKEFDGNYYLLRCLPY